MLREVMTMMEISSSFNAWMNCSISFPPHHHHRCSPHRHHHRCIHPSTSSHAAPTPTALPGRRSQFAWTNLISHNINRGEYREALQIWKQMQEAGVRASTYTFVAALKACGCLGDLQTGRQIHALVIQSGVELQIFVASTLISMYAKCGSMEDAHLVFERMPHTDVVLWNAMILGYAQRGEGELALQLYEQMQQKGFAPEARTFVGALKACSCLAVQEEDKKVDGKLLKLCSLKKGRIIHSEVAKSGLDSDIYVASTLIDMYTKCGSMEDAYLVFERMPHPGVVSWNAMILGYAQRGEGELALQLYEQMQRKDFAPDSRTFVGTLKACSYLAAQEDDKKVDGKLLKLWSLQKGRSIHSQVAKSGLDSDIFVANTLIDMYAKCGSMEDADLVFERMPHPDVVSWNAMILGYAQRGEGELALQLYEQMQRKGFAPDALTFVGALKACSCLAAQEEDKKVDGKLLKLWSLQKGRSIHFQVAKSGLHSDIFVATGLVDMYAKCGSMEDAYMVFQRMPHPDVVSWTAMILGYARRGEGELALQLYEQMQRKGFVPDARTFVGALKACNCLAAQEEGKKVHGKLVKVSSLKKGRIIHSQASKCGLDSDIYVANTMVDLYAQCGSMQDARRVFETMPSRDVVSWTAMILGYAENEQGEQALQLYARFQHEGLTPNAQMFVAALKACGSVAALGNGKKTHAEICKVGLEGDTILATCLIDMYGKCGSMDDAQQSFDKMPKRDIVTWTALISGYSRRGESECVFFWFQRMLQEGVQPNGMVFLPLLTVCSHVGMVDQGWKYFHAMSADYGITPTIDHYNSIIDLLGRAGQLDDAEEMVKKMPFQPDMIIWLTLLGSCRKWNNVEVGRHAFECAVRLDNNHAAAYILMSNIYAAAGMREESHKVQAMQKNAGAWKKPEQSWWTDAAGIVHTFIVGDTTHPQSKDIYAKMKSLFVKMEEEGYYAPDADNVLLNMSDDEKKHELCSHSEKLAIACALINSPPGTPIRIVKNLRVCKDCHNASSVISKIEQRVIICRDANRFHVYKDGKCSCGEFW